MIHAMLPSKINQVKVSQQSGCDVTIGIGRALLTSYVCIFQLSDVATVSDKRYIQNVHSTGSPGPQLRIAAIEHPKNACLTLN